MTLQLRSYILWLIVTITLSGCTPSQSVNTQTPTAKVQASATPHPTETNLPATVTPFPSPTSKPPLLATSLPLAQGSTLILVSETIPDGTNFQPGQTFQKTWTLMNNGARAWDKSFVFIRTSTNPDNTTLGSLERIPFSKEVKPGDTLQIGVDLVAPKQDGQYTVFYQLQDGVGSFVSNSQIWVTITVGNIPNPGSEVVTNTMHGITATLTSFTHDTQSGTVDFCMSVSFHKYTLDSAPSLLIDQKSAPFLTGSSNFAGGPGCMEMQYQLSSTEIEQAQHISLFIDGSLRMSPPPGDPDVACQTARLNLMAQHPGLDFQCHFCMAGYYTNLHLPTGMTREQANTLIVDTIEGAIYGPWTLTIK